MSDTPAVGNQNATVQSIITHAEAAVNPGAQDAARQQDFARDLIAVNPDAAETAKHTLELKDSNKLNEKVQTEIGIISKGLKDYAQGSIAGIMTADMAIPNHAIKAVNNPAEADFLKELVKASPELAQDTVKELREPAKYPGLTAGGKPIDGIEAVKAADLIRADLREAIGGGTEITTKPASGLSPAPAPLPSKIKQR